MALVSTSTAVNGMNSLRPVVVNKRSPDFQRVHYMLEMALLHADVKITHIQIWDIGSPTQVDRFDDNLKRRRGQPPLDSWIDMEGMDPVNSEENIFRQGKYTRARLLRIKANNVSPIWHN